jgi:uncharacterized protein YkwD
MVAVFAGTEQSFAAAPEVEAAPLHDLSSTTTLSVLHANLVGSNPISDVEQQLTDDVIEATTTTLPPTTTTTLAPTTTAAPTRSSSGGSSGGGSSGGGSSGSPSPTTTAPPPAPSGGYRSDYESDFYGRINSLRSANGLNSVSRSGSLDSRARWWAKEMAKRGKLSHSNLSSLLPPWSAAGENVGKGGAVSAVFNALKGSSGHYSVMTGDFTHVGVGVWVDGNGTLWTVHVFAR